MPPHACSPGGVILQWPGTPLLGPTTPALPGTWQRKWFLKQRETQEGCSVPARAASQLGMAVNLENQGGACPLPAATPQGRPWLPSPLLNSTRRGCQHEEVRGTHVLGLGTCGAVAAGLGGGALGRAAGKRWADRKWSRPFHLRMSRIGSLGQPRSLTARAPALLALWLRCPSSGAFWTVALGLPRLLQKWTRLTRGWWPTRDLGSSECGPVASDVSQPCLLKRTVVLHCSRMSGLY